MNAFNSQDALTTRYLLPVHDYREACADLELNATGYSFSNDRTDLCNRASRRTHVMSCNARVYYSKNSGLCSMIIVLCVVFQLKSKYAAENEFITI